ncbi:MAG: RdgB/HAM1 family non-canonical purine NTP pyrophosphatase [Calditrichia bacterium]|nr:RdgB/HAM1 family non-canonical purine NTP pyrophosphatase [Calditrichia bacterium]
MKSLKKIVIGTSNPHKFEEIVQILQEIPAQFLSLQNFPDIPPIEETGSTFQENALLKARTVYKHTSLLTLADDSGLEVEALRGAPGIYSARFAGTERDYAANNLKLLESLKEIPDQQRNAQFRCVVGIVGPNTEQVVEGVVRGRIIREMLGGGGFGYDPLFIPDGFTETFAEMGEELKNRISHRAVAFQKARFYLENLVLLK